MRLEMRRTTDMFPVQYEGTLEGRPFYFRAKYDEWLFGVADTRDAAIEGPSFSDQFPVNAFYCMGQWGDGPEAASYMPFEEAERLIEVCAEAYMNVTKRNA